MKNLFVIVALLLGVSTLSGCIAAAAGAGAVGGYEYSQRNHQK